MAILLPVIQRARGSAYQSVCISNLHQAGQAIRMYMSDHDNDDFLPPKLEAVDDAYIKSPQIFLCSLDDTHLGYAHSIFGTGRPYGKRISYGYAGSLYKADPDLHLAENPKLSLFCDTLHGTDKPAKGWETTQEFAVDGAFASPPNWLPIYEGKCLRVMQDGHVALGTFHIERHPDGSNAGWGLKTALTQQP